ncbi:fatty acyl-CoA reductase wat-like isoform X1 [Anopheles albimanus]|uniref:fatty acyl-CoA reductase wat-like isoform X1 n=1 Tax=Anopheles albimanus TaxID=7167 RepID=UPI00163F6F01|nr:fatty acyl-CoA reductase wat-like isoform X1 [Anopheles albimanus]
MALRLCSGGYHGCAQIVLRSESASANHRHCTMDMRVSEETAHNNELTMTEERKITSTPVMEFYRDKCVLITGGTGFIGRLLIEKMLRINVRQIILLSRPKKGKTVQERCDDLFSSVVFMNLKKEFPTFTERVKLIDADLQHPSLGLSDESIEFIVNNTQIVLHAASDVRFDQALKKAIEVNVRGTRDLLRIAEKIVNLEVFIYISTAYSNCPQSVIREQFYTPPSDPERMIQLVEAMDERFEEHMNKTVNDFIHPWPNTYVYTKALTEDIVRQYGQLLPVAVVRPSIVIATNEEPIGGWTDNIYGLNGVIAGVALGIIRIMHVDDNNAADIIPADIVVNAVLAAGWQTHIERFIYHHLRKHERPLPAAQSNGELKGVAKPRTKIYNCVTGTDNPISYQKIYEYSIEVGKSCPPKKSLWIVCHNTTKSKYMYEFYKLLYHLLPAFLIDTYLRAIRRTPRIMDLYRKVHKFATVIEYFANGKWTFENENMRSLRDRLSPDDQIMFPCNVKKLVWVDYFWTYIHGLRKHIANEPLENLDEAIKRHKQMRILHFFILVAYYSVCALILFYLAKAVGILLF